MKKKMLAAVLAVGMILSLAACGNGGNSGGSNNASASGQTQGEAKTEVDDTVQGVTDTEIKVGNTAAVSGAYAPVGVPFIAGIESYFKMINDQGGIDGRKITFVHKDDEFDPVKGKAYLQEMVEDEKVFAIVGHFGTPVVAATIDDLKSYGIPSVYFATGIGQLYAEHAETNADGYNLFPVQPIYTTEGQIMVARGIGTFNAKKIGIIYTSDDAGKDMLTGAKEKCEELGIEYVSEQVATDIAGKFDVYGNGWVSYDDERADNLALYQEWTDAEYADNAYAQTGWIAAAFFCDGLNRLAEEGKDVTWANYMAALEEAPLQNPFGGTIDYANGLRAGTQVMNLSKINASQPTGWELVDGLKSMDELFNVQ